MVSRGKQALVLASLHALLVQAVNLQFTRRSISAHTAGLTVDRHVPSSLGVGDVEEGVMELGNVEDLRYTSYVKINGQEVHVVLDTGSTDLWVAPPGGLLRPFNDSGIPVELLYGDGTYGISGTIGVAEVEFGDYVIPQQAFLHGTQANGINGLTDLGIHGLLGLSFQHGFASPINSAVQEADGPGATWGQSVLHNIFDQHPDQPNFIAIDLVRTDDLEDTSGGSFGIGEYDSEFASVANAPKLPLYPPGSDRWTTLLSGIKVDGANVPLRSNIKGVPAGSVSALLDTGDPTAIVSTELFDAIYGAIPGAILYNRQGTRTWIIPCNTTASVALTFGGQDYPIHPLDLSNFATVTLHGEEYSACVASFKVADNWGGPEFDISLGASFLRNVYSVYDFGDPQPDGTVGEGYMQLLSQTDPTKAAGQVQERRAKTMASLPPEVDPLALQLFLSGGDAAGVTKSGSRPSGSGSASDEEEVLRASASSESASVGSYGIAVIALLSANLIVTLILAVFAILLYIRRGRASAHWSPNKGSYAPIRPEDEYKQQHGHHV